MFRKILRLFCLSLLCLSTACSNNQGNTLRIATASNMQFAMEALSKKFFEQTSIPCEVILGSSGKLTAQIKAGAPYNLFVSADMKYPEELFKEKFTIGKPSPYALGRLVLWSNKNEPININLSTSLSDSELEYIALANPETAPYGKAAMEVLTRLELAKVLKSKLVFGESIAQTNQFISSKAADIGFTSKSVVLSPQLQGQGVWLDISPTYHSPIAQGVALLNVREELADEAQQFHDFLFSDAAKEILNKFGYASVNQ